VCKNTEAVAQHKKKLENRIEESIPNDNDNFMTDVEKAVALDNAFKLDCWRMADNRNFDRLIGALFHEMVKHGMVKIKNTGKPYKSRQNIRNHIRIFILSLFVAFEHEPGKPIRYSRDRNKYKKGSRYNPDFISYRYTRLVSNFLKRAGYVDYYPGFQSKNNAKQSRILATDKLIRLFKQYDLSLDMVYRDPNEEIIKLTNTEDEEIEYEETQDTSGMRDQLRSINELLQQQNYELDPEPAELEKLKKRIDFTKKRVTRNFSRNQFDKGGRFYGGFWTNMPAEYRQCIKINGESIVELDFSGLHITMLYINEGVTPPEGDAYHLDDYPTNGSFRKFVKTLTNIMINASDDENARKGLCGKIWEDLKNKEKAEDKKFKLPPEIKSTKKEDLDPVMRAIRTKHRAVQHHFCSDMGISLQYMDSQIALKVMLYFFEKSIVVLPEHDSFIIQAQHEPELKSVMTQAFKDVMNTDYKISISKK
jgi:hypothetical protein